MSSNNLPDGWKAGEVVSGDEIYSDPPESSDPTKNNLYGLAEGDSAHRLYSIPSDTPVSEVVRFFEVGSHSAESYGDDAAETIAFLPKVSLLWE